ncbi:hypothetical protein BJ878DRAFT_570097 [Calycina marina]|uniref:Uncharacterized protein n=1 Tax=Calycina marina TaxID=1763456 RepID=A0A9P8CDP7_9HELO|nr:hypothetical protein BJ878DRAFT_570097 [Calycina marina]
MASDSSRKLFTGSIRPPNPKPVLGTRSYTQKRISKNDISIVESDAKIGKKRRMEFSSQAVPMPFLDPSIMLRRLQAEHKRKAEQDRKIK